MIYGSALEPSLWPQVADRLADLMGGTVCQFSTFDTRTKKAGNVSPRLSPEAASFYENHWVHQNPLVAAGIQKAVGEVFSTFDLVPRDELTRTAIYNEFFAPLELEHAVGAKLLMRDGFWASFGVWRPRQMSPFDRKDVRLLRSLIPHLQRAVELGHRFAELEMARSASAEILERLDKAALLVDTDCRVMFTNRAAG